MFRTKQLKLDDSLLIGNGGVRKVYQHPLDNNRCIKVTYNHSRRRSVRREILYLCLYRLRNKPFLHLPRFHGFCDSNRGRGAIFDLYRDYNGKRSVMLSEHIAQTSSSPLSPWNIVALLDELLNHLLENEIIVSDPAPSNLLVHYVARNRPRLVIVDGIGNPHFVKIADISTHFAHKIIKKKWWYYVENHPTLQNIFAQTGYKHRY